MKLSEKLDLGGPDIQVWPDYVLIVGHVVPRPTRIARSVWLDYWGSRHWIEKGS